MKNTYNGGYNKPVNYHEVSENLMKIFGINNTKNTVKELLEEQSFKLKEVDLALADIFNKRENIEKLSDHELTYENVLNNGISFWNHEAEKGNIEDKEINSMEYELAKLLGKDKELLSLNNEPMSVAGVMKELEEY